MLMVGELLLLLLLLEQASEYLRLVRHLVVSTWLSLVVPLRIVLQLYTHEACSSASVVGCGGTRGVERTSWYTWSLKAKSPARRGITCTCSDRPQSAQRLTHAHTALEQSRQLALHETGRTWTCGMV